jgi:hypothetical protein
MLNRVWCQKVIHETELFFIFLNNFLKFASICIFNHLFKSHFIFIYNCFIKHCTK